MFYQVLPASAWLVRRGKNYCRSPSQWCPFFYPTEKRVPLLVEIEKVVLQIGSTLEFRRSPFETAFAMLDEHLKGLLLVSSPFQSQPRKGSPEKSETHFGVRFKRLSGRRAKTRRRARCSFMQPGLTKATCKQVACTISLRVLGLFVLVWVWGAPFWW